MCSIVRSTGTVFYSLLNSNSRRGFNGLKYVYSVISVIVDLLAGSTKNRQSTRSWTARVRLFHLWAVPGNWLEIEWEYQPRDQFGKKKPMHHAQQSEPWGFPIKSNQTRSATIWIVEMFCKIVFRDSSRISKLFESGLVRSSSHALSQLNVQSELCEKKVVWPFQHTPTACLNRVQGCGVWQLCLCLSISLFLARLGEVINIW